MNLIKQKMIRQRDLKDNLVKSNRYNVQLKSNCDSTPALLKMQKDVQQSQQINKENNLNNFNRQSNNYRELSKSNNFETFKSGEYGQKLKPNPRESALQDDAMVRISTDDIHRLHQSQEEFVFPQKNQQELIPGMNFGDHLTFGFVNNKNTKRNNGLTSSRQFLEEKRMKNEVLDELIENNKRQQCKSMNSFELASTFPCINHENKKAKYKLVADQNDEEDMFYCSKCAINLLQQGFKIQELKTQSQPSNQSHRFKEITKLELKLKSIEEKTKLHLAKSKDRHPFQNLERNIYKITEEYDQMIEILMNMKNNILSELKQYSAKKQSDVIQKRSNIQNAVNNLIDIQKQVREYKSKVNVMKENEFNFLMKSLNNKISIFQKFSGEETCEKDFRQMNQHLHGLISNSQRIYEFLSDQIQTKTQPYKINSDEPFTQEYNKPFRNLFPDEENDLECKQVHHSIKESKHLLNSIREYPTFGNYA